MQYTQEHLGGQKFQSFPILFFHQQKSYDKFKKKRNKIHEKLEKFKISRLQRTKIETDLLNTNSNSRKE